LHLSNTADDATVNQESKASAHPIVIVRQPSDGPRQAGRDLGIHADFFSAGSRADGMDRRVEPGDDGTICG
jgi:hypothetical protein